MYFLLHAQKKVPKKTGGNGKAASRPARAHAQKDYVSRNNIIDGLGHRRPGPPPARPFGRRATVASPAALILPTFRKVQPGDRLLKVSRRSPDGDQLRGLLLFKLYIQAGNKMHPQTCY
jgi:hypothetical protein